MTHQRVYPERSRGTIPPALRIWCGRQEEFIPSLAEGNLHASCVRAKIDGAVYQAVFLFVAPTLDLLLAGSGRLANGMRLKPNERRRVRALRIRRALSRSVPPEPTPQMGRDSAVVGAVRTEEEVASPAVWEIIRESPSVHDVARDKLSLSESLVRETGVEPARPFGHKILSLARLPVPPLPRWWLYSTSWELPLHRDFLHLFQAPRPPGQAARDGAGLAPGLRA
jgi:hypothetical protein